MMPIRRTRYSTPPATFRAIWRIVATVPRGHVVTYGQVARMAGLPGAARTVGWAMQALPGDFRIMGRPVPWHRVINVQGRISPRGGGEGVESLRQANLLRREGIRFSKDGVIDLGRFHWPGDHQRRRQH